MSMGLYLLGFIHKRLSQKQRELGYASKRSGHMWTMDIGFKQKRASTFDIISKFNKNF